MLKRIFTSVLILVLSMTSFAAIAMEEEPISRISPQTVKDGEDNQNFREKQMSFSSLGSFEVLSNEVIHRILEELTPGEFLEFKCVSKKSELVARDISLSIKIAQADWLHRNASKIGKDTPLIELHDNLVSYIFRNVSTSSDLRLSLIYLNRPFPTMHMEQDMEKYKRCLYGIHATFAAARTCNNKNTLQLLKDYLHSFNICYVDSDNAGTLSSYQGIRYGRE